MTEYEVLTREGARKFQSDHEAKLLGDLTNLDNYLHEHPDNVTTKLIKKHRLLTKLPNETVDIINGFLNNMNER